MRAKYVIVEDAVGLELAIVFNPIFNHSDFKKFGTKVIGAGQCTISPDWRNKDADEPLVQCFGESFTLKVKSRGEEDAKAIMRSFRE